MLNQIEVERAASLRREAAMLVTTSNSRPTNIPSPAGVDDVRGYGHILYAVTTERVHGM